MKCGPFVLAGMLVSSMSYAHAEQQKAVARWTVADIALGSPIKNVPAGLKKAEPSISIRDSKGSLTREGASTPEIYFGLVGLYNGNGRVDNTTVVSDFSSQGKVAAVIRNLTFSYDEQPPLTTLVASLQEKYGTPSKVIAAGRLEKMYVWDDGSGIDIRTRRGFDACRNFTSMFWLFLNNNSSFGDDLKQRNVNCGTYVVADISLGEKGEATGIRYQLIDYRTLKAAYEFTDRILTAGQNEIQSKRSKNKGPAL